LPWERLIVRQRRRRSSRCLFIVRLTSLPLLASLRREYTLVMDGNTKEDGLRDLESRFRLTYPKHVQLIEQLEQAPLKTGERKSLATVVRVWQEGLASVLGRLRSAESTDNLLILIEQCSALGPTVVLQVGSQRGGDFLLNQLRGQWAEKVCCSIAWPGHKIVEYGPSGAAMPGEEVRWTPLSRQFSGPDKLRPSSSSV
jgi:hypothetical protein